MDWPGQASGATNAIRELGGVIGVAVLASVFSANGSYASPQAFSDTGIAPGGTRAYRCLRMTFLHPHVTSVTTA